ncbi:MAG: cytochrome c [Candidatus Binatia bacterium]
MNARFSRAVLVAIALALCGGCRQDMHDQPKYKTLAASRFFPDGQSARPLVLGTVARNHLDDDVEFYSGKTAAGKLMDVFPMAVTADVLKRGQERFNIYCSPCHDRTGGGLGMVVRRGFKQPPSLHIERLRQAPPGHLFDVMTSGFGAMPDYRSPVPASDRWAIAAYIRVLQRSQQATLADAPPEEAAKLQGGG